MNAYFRGLPVFCPQVFCLLVLAITLSGCARANSTAQQQTAATPVTAHRVALHDLPETVILPGRIVPIQQTAVTATFPGQIETVRVQIGDAVKKGQVLAALDSTNANQNLADAEQSLHTLEQQVATLHTSGAGGADITPSVTSLDAQAMTLQKKIGERLTTLVSQAQHLTVTNTSPAALAQTGQELLQLQADVTRLQTQALLAHQMENALKAPMLQALQGQIAGAHQAVSLAEQQVRAHTLTAPIDGVILSQAAAPGSPAAPGMPLFTIGNVSKVVFEMLVDPSIQSRLKSGQSASVQLGNETPVSASLASVSPALDPQSRAFTARATLHNDNSQYKPGQIGQATVTLAPHSSVVAVPSSAILHDEQGAYVLQIKNKTATPTRVTTGYTNGTWTEIRHGLAKNDLIVAAGLDRVQSGTQLQIIRTETNS